MDRLIIESIEGRIMLGITMFVAIMILVGWVAINEPARMAEFVEQHEGRSIERGAELFAANCSTCHGVNGYGIAGRAPALNNPQLFAYSYLSSVNSEIASYQRDLLDINGTDEEAGTLALLEARRTELETQLAEASEGDARDILVSLLNVEATLSEDIEDVAARIEALETIVGDDEDEIDDLPLMGDDVEPELSNSELAARLSALQENIPTRLAEADAALNGVDSESGLLNQREALLTELADGGAFINGYLPELDVIREDAANDPLLLTNYIEEDANRLTQIGFGGSLEGYLTTTLIHGRPGSGDVYSGNIMSSWSQRGGGPLRDDQIGDIVAYILNWDRGDDWAIEDFNAVNQFAIQHARYTGSSDSDVETVGDDVDEILSNGLPEGDAARGEELYNADALAETGVTVGCSSCHLGGIIGPDTIGTWTRAQQRLEESQFADYTAEQYLIESIVHPDAYVVAGYTGGVMNANFGDQLSAQDLADLVAYLATQDQ